MTQNTTEIRINTYNKFKEEFIEILKKHEEYLQSFEIKNDENKILGYTRPLFNNTNFERGLHSTCFAITSFSKAKLLDEKSKDNFFEFIKTSHWNIKRLKQSANVGNEDDVYTIPIILNSLKYLGQISNSTTKAAISKRIKNSLEKLAIGIKPNRGLKFGDKYPESGFLTFSALKSFFEWRDIPSPKIDEAIEHAYFWMETELYKQLGYYKSNNYDMTDPIRCIFSLAGYKRCYDEKKYQNGRNLEFLKDKTFDKKLYDEVIRCIFEDQQENGLWKKYQPTFAIPDYGNVYPFAIYSLDRLVDLSDETVEIFDNYSNNIRMALDWINANILEYNYGGKLFKGWRSPHSTTLDGPPQCWSTALVFDAVSCMKKKVASDLNKEIIENLYKGKFFNTQKIKETKYNPEVDKPFEIKLELKKLDNYFVADGEHGEKFGEDLEKICDSILKFEDEFDLDEKKFKNQHGERIDLPPNAIMLYGPPGTGKTFLTQLVANKLGWSYLRIDTSMLLNQGLDKAAISINSVFEYLSYLERTVVLFDEIDETIKKRTLSQGGIENRVLTNVMLTKLNDLKDNKKILYFVNTNYYEQIDKAIKRKGRFDKSFHVGLSKKELRDINIEKIFNHTTNNIFSAEKNNEKNNLFDQKFDTLVNDMIKTFVLNKTAVDLITVENIEKPKSALLGHIKKLTTLGDKDTSAQKLIKDEIEKIEKESTIKNEDKKKIKELFKKIFIEEMYNSKRKDIVFLSEEYWEDLIKGMIKIIPLIYDDIPTSNEISIFDWFVSIWKPLSDKITQIKAVEAKDDVIT